MGTGEQWRRETLAETWASFALDGLLPTEADRASAREYIAGEVTLEASSRRRSPSPGRERPLPGRPSTTSTVESG